MWIYRGDFIYDNIATKLIEIVKSYSSGVNLPDYDIGRFKMFLKSGENRYSLSEDGTIVISIFQIEKDVMGYLSINSNEFVLKICEHSDLSDAARKILNIDSTLCKIPEGVCLILKSGAERYEEFNVKNFLLSKVIKKIFRISLKNKNRKFLMVLVACARFDVFICLILM